MVLVFTWLVLNASIIDKMKYIWQSKWFASLHLYYVRHSNQRAQSSFSIIHKELSNRHEMIDFFFIALFQIINFEKKKKKKNLKRKNVLFILNEEQSPLTFMLSNVLLWTWILISSTSSSCFHSLSLSLVSFFLYSNLLLLLYCSLLYRLYNVLLYFEICHIKYLEMGMEMKKSTSWEKEEKDIVERC